MKKIILALLIFMCVLFAACHRTDGAVASADEVYTYLVAGVDDAASNTDVLLLASYNVTADSLTVLQIPRDTYSKYEGNYGKINRIIPLLRARGYSIGDAMSELTAYISHTLGVAIDGYFSADIDALEKTVDLIGGVDITLGDALDVTDEHGELLYRLNEGQNHLDGKAAGQFVRFRRGYATGDLGRIDAQKIFLKAFFESARENIGLDEAARLALEIAPDIKTDIGVFDTLKLLLKSRIKDGETSMTFATLPGEPVMLDNVSFYVINRKNAAEFIHSHLITNGEFDPDQYFNNRDLGTVSNIYFDVNSNFKYFES